MALAHDVEGNDVCQRTSLHVLHHHPEVTLDQERIHKVDDVPVLGFAHNQDLVDNQIFLRLLVQVHLLDGNATVGANLVRGENATGSSLSNLGEISVHGGGIRRVADRVQPLDDIARLSTLPLPPLTRATTRRSGAHARCLGSMGSIVRVGCLSKLLLWVWWLVRRVLLVVSLAPSPLDLRLLTSNGLLSREHGLLLLGLVLLRGALRRGLAVIRGGWVRGRIRATKLTGWLSVSILIGNGRSIRDR